MKISLFLITGFVLLGTLLELSNPDRGPRDTQWERIQATHTLVVGIDPSLPPFGQWTEQGATGFDPALAQALGEKLNLEVRFVLLSYDGLYDSLILGYVDMVIAALRPDPQRMDRVRYTSPYFDAGQIFVSQNPVNSWDEIQTLAVEMASEGDLAARKIDNLNPQRFLTAQEALESVTQGQTQAALVDHVSALAYGGLRLADQPILPDPYAIALRRSDWRLYRAVEQALTTLRTDGTLDALLKQWLVPAVLPSNEMEAASSRPDTSD